tara:strand:+ start:542 stop:1126 length:585 start_codon:yes stop_codon:yes gene_type:complete
MAIATLANFKVFARVETASVDDTFLQYALDAAESAVRSMTGRYLAVAGSATARSFVPSGVSALRIDDCTSVTSIVDDGTTLVDGTDYQLEPVNGVNSGGESVPYTTARRLGGVWATSTDGEATVVVTAAWGWSAIPSWAVSAVLILARDIVQARDQVGGVAGFGEFGAVRVRENPMVAAILAPHKRGDRAWGIA